MATFVSVQTGEGFALQLGIVPIVGSLHVPFLNMLCAASLDQAGEGLNL